MRKSVITTKQIIGIMLIAFFVMLIVIISFFCLTKVYKTFTVEAGTDVPSISQFIKNREAQGIFLTDLSSIDMRVPNVYDVEIQIGKKIYKSKLKIEDTTPPTAEIVNKEITIGETIEAKDFITNIVDVTDVTISYIDEPDFAILGEQDVSILLEDTGRNKTEMSAKLYIGKVHKLVTIEIGAQELDISRFLMSNEFTGKFVSDISKIDLSRLGTHDLIVEVDGEEYPSQLEIVDTTQPKGDAVGQEVWANEYIEAKEFVENVSDHTDVKVYYKEQPDFSKAGEQKIIVILEDECNNQTELQALLTVKEDTEPPKILGAHDQTVYIGDKVSYKRGITVTDNKDENIDLVVDSSTVNLKKEGTYDVIYTATDSSNNTTTKNVTFKVAVKPEDYVDKTDLDALADEVLASIIKDDMSQREKAEAIYKWTKHQIGYVNQSDKSDWVKAAYQGIKKRSGDCFVYYSTAQELLTRAGIENQGIVKIGEGHYWNLVNCGDGWYHFDATPRIGGGEFFMLTDEEIEEYSKKHKNSHVWDKTKYPATPLE